MNSQLLSGVGELDGLCVRRDGLFHGGVTVNLSGRCLISNDNVRASQALPPTKVKDNSDLGKT